MAKRVLNRHHANYSDIVSAAFLDKGQRGENVRSLQDNLNPATHITWALGEGLRSMERSGINVSGETLPSASPYTVLMGVHLDNYPAVGARFLDGETGRIILEADDTGDLQVWINSAYRSSGLTVPEGADCVVGMRLNATDISCLVDNSVAAVSPSTGTRVGIDTDLTALFSSFDISGTDLWGPRGKLLWWIIVDADMSDTDWKALGQAPTDIYTECDYFDSIQRKGPACQWRFGEASGTTSYDESSNGLNITWVVAPTQGVTGIAGGGSDTAVTFNGSTHRGTFADNAAWKNASVSVECWIKRGVASTAIEGVLDAAATAAGVQLAFDASGNIVFETNNGAGSTLYAFINDDAWHHVVGTFSTANGLALYLDGVSVATDAYLTAISWTGARHEVGSVNSGNFLAASLDELTFHSRELSAVEVEDHYEKGLGTIEHYDELAHEYYPAGYWRMGQASGNTLDETDTSAQPIVWTGSPTTGVAGALTANTDDDDTAITLNGSSQYGTITNTTLLQNLTAFTIGFWIKTTSLGYGTIVDKISSGAAWLTTGYYVAVDTAGGIELQVRDTSTYTLNSVRPIHDGNWHYVACSFDGSTMAVFIDGRVDSTAAGGSLATNTADLDICASAGNPGGTTLYFDGSLDELKIYPHALPPHEARKLFTWNRATAATQTKEEFLLAKAPMALWRYSEQSGDVALDHTSIGNHITWDSGKIPYQKGEAPTPRDPSGSCVFDDAHYGTVPSASLFETSPHLSVEVWMRRPVIAAASEGVLDLAASSAGLILRYTATGDIHFGVNDTLGIVEYAFPNDNEWHHVVGTYSPATGIILYLDGISVDTDVYSTALSYTSIRHRVGDYGGVGTATLDSHVGDLLLYNYVLTAAEALENFEFVVLEDAAEDYGAHQLEYHPNVLWRLGESSGSAALDETSYQNTLSWAGGGDPTRGVSGFKPDEDSDTATLFTPNEYGQFVEDDSTKPPLLTVECWVKRAAAATVEEGIYDRFVSNKGTMLGFKSDGNVQWRINTTSTNYAYPTDGAWHHLAATYGVMDGLRLYLDGAEVATAAYSTAIDYTSVDRYFGWFTGYLSATVDEFVLFPYIKSPSRILVDYQWTAPEEEEPPAEPPVDLYFNPGPFDAIPAYLLGAGVPALQIEPNTVEVKELPKGILGMAMPAFALVPPVVATPADEFIMLEDFSVALVINRADGYVVSETFTAIMLLKMFDSFGMESAISFSYEMDVLVSESFSFAESIGPILRMGVASGFAFSESSTVHGFLVQIADTFGFGEEFVSRIEIALARSDSSGWTEEYIAALQMGRSEQFALAESFIAAVVLLDAASDSFALTEARTDQLYLAFSRSDSVGWDDSLSAQLEALVGRSDSFGLMGVFSFVGGEKYMAWVVHPKTKAPYKFKNYPFTGFATAGGRVLACADDGIYQLHGDQDAGAAIRGTFLRTGSMNLGSEFTKRLEEAYLAYSSTGETLIKVIFSKAGKQTESWYKLSQRTQDVEGQAELPIHRGIESVYYQFELALMDGKPTRIEQFTLLPMVTTRMI